MTWINLLSAFCCLKKLVVERPHACVCPQRFFSETVSKRFFGLNEIVGDLRSRVCLYVRPFVTLFLRNRSLHLSETLQLGLLGVRKNFSNAFLVIFAVLAILAKTSQNWPFGWICTTVSLKIPEKT